MQTLSRFPSENEFSCFEETTQWFRRSSQLFDLNEQEFHLTRTAARGWRGWEKSSLWNLINRNRGSNSANKILSSLPAITFSSWNFMRETRFYISTTGSKIVYHVTATADNEEKRNFSQLLTKFLVLLCIYIWFLSFLFDRLFIYFSDLKMRYATNLWKKKRKQIDIFGRISWIVKRYVTK